MKAEEKAEGTLEHWSPEEVAQALKGSRILLIDVRTPQEYALERIPGAVLSPMQEFDPAHIPQPGVAEDVVFHCGSGKRSQMMAEKALAAGWSVARHMQGGMAAWKSAGLDYIGTELSTGAPKRMSES